MADNETKTVTLIAPNGMQVSVAESKKDARLRGGYRLPGKAAKSSGKTGSASDDGSATSSKYDALKLDELKQEIDERNGDREDDEQLSRTGNKSDLVAALVADDAAGN